jgi:hypothetical protein
MGMSRVEHMAAMQAATLTAQRQQEVMEGAIKLYGALSQVDAERFRDMACAALDSILDAKRAYGIHFERLLRDPEE